MDVAAPAGVAPARDPAPTTATVATVLSAVLACVLSGGRLDRPAHVLVGFGAAALLSSAAPAYRHAWAMLVLASGAAAAAAYERTLGTTLFPDPLDITMGWFGLALGVVASTWVPPRGEPARALRRRAALSIAVGVVLRWLG